MLIIRFSRVGKKNHAQYKVVVAEKSFPVKGKFIEQLGSYDPHLKVASLKGERINYWIGNGAECSDSAYNLFVKEGVIDGEKRQIKIKEKKKDAKTEGEEGEASKEDGAKDESSPKDDAPAEEKKEEVKNEEAKEEVKEESKAEEKKEEIKEDSKVEDKKEEVKEDPKTEDKKEEVKK